MSGSTEPPKSEANRQVTFKELFNNRRYFSSRLKKVPELIRFQREQRKRGWQAYGNTIEYSAERFPYNTAIQFEDEKISYLQLNKRINKVAHFLRAKGLGQGDVVALFMENRPEYIINIFAIAKLGAIASLINNSQSGQVLTHSVNLVEARFAIIGEELLETFEEIREQTYLDKDVYYWPDRNVSFKGNEDELKKHYINLESASENCPVENPRIRTKIRKNDPCLYIYTSGTTGLPKATIQKHKKLVGVYSAVGMVTNPLKQSDVLYSTLPLYHATALLVCWSSVMANGASFVIRRKFSASEFWRDIDRYNATAFGYVGELCRYLINQEPRKDDASHGVRVVMGNGLKAELWKEFKERFQVDEIRELYASSEGNTGSFNFFNIDETVGMIAGPHAIVEFDTDRDEPIRGEDNFMKKVEPGEAGLLLGKVTPLTPFEGYTQSDKNEAKLLRDVFKKGDKWFNTGDLIKEVGFKHIQFVDRTGDTFRWKGENVSTEQIEKISNQFPEIEESLVYGVEIPHTNGRAGMVAITLKDKDKAFDGKSYCEFMNSQLSHFAVPLFIRIQDEFERTGTFKYQRAHLKKDGFNTKLHGDPLLVLLPGSDTYERLSDDIAEKIGANEYRF